MKRFLCIILIIVVIPIISYSKQDTRIQTYNIPSSVIGEGGDTIGNSSIQIKCTIGQPVIGTISNIESINDIGFWYIERILITLEPPPGFTDFDFNNDGIVDIKDIQEICAHYEMSAVGNIAIYDYNNNDIIDIDDIKEAINHWGQ